MVAAALGLAGCGLVPARRAGTTAVGVAAAEPSVLVLLVDPGSPGGAMTARGLLAATARPGEHLILLDDRDAAVLASSVVPRAAPVRVPEPPAAPPPDPTSFQQASYRRAVSRYRAALRSSRAALRDRQQRLQAAWAASASAAVSRAAGRHLAAGETGTLRALGVGLAGIFSLQQAGLVLGDRKVVAILGLARTPGASPPGLPGGLAGTTVVVTGFTGDSDDEAAWQAGLLQAGATRAVLLSPAAGDQLAAVVRQGLNGAVADTLGSVLFGLGQATLRPAAAPALDHLLHLLTVTHPGATASIDGYTDDLPAPMGNLELSRLRADAVQAWLVAHGVAPGRLQAAGDGDADPVAPNGPDGQPLNRRVVVIIDPPAAGS